MKLREPDELDRRWLEQRLSAPRPGVVANRSTRGRLAVREHLAACDRIRAIDQEMTALAAERRRLVERVHGLDRLLDGTARIPHPVTGAPLHVRYGLIPPRTRFGRPGPHWRRTATTDEVRALVLDVLSSTEAPVRVRELVAVLSAHGLETVAPASQAVSNLLRAELAAGRVERTARGVYRWIAETGPA
jgi:hypothetical protein